MDGRTDERTEKRTNEQKSPCVLQDIVPFGASVLKLRMKARYQIILVYQIILFLTFHYPIDRLSPPPHNKVFQALNKVPLD